MFVSHQLDDLPPFSRVERKLAVQLQRHCEFAKGFNFGADGGFDMPDDVKERMFCVIARAALTAYHDLRGYTYAELMDDGREYPPISLGEMFRILDEDSYLRRHGDNGVAPH